MEKAFMSAQTNDEWSRWARTYERSWFQPLLFDRVHKVMLDLLAGEGEESEPERVLDVGCGTGKLLRKVRARWPTAQLIGVDATEEMVDVAHRLAPAVTFCVGVAEVLPLPDASVDVALSTYSFHHWNDQAAGVREVARVLRPGGRFFLADVQIPAGLATILRHFLPKNPHSRTNNRAALRGFFVQAGLDVQVQRPTLDPFGLVTLGMKN
jgi:ubiquinone/menaquinone biosynthesis C-methylase UbiE